MLILILNGNGMMMRIYCGSISRYSSDMVTWLFEIAGTIGSRQ